MVKLLPKALLPLALLACSSATPEPSGPATTDDQHRAEAVHGLHDAYLVELQTLLSAAEDLQRAAPLPPDRGWDAIKDRAAIAAMKGAWIRARTAYERVEGALAPLFPDLDVSIDARYDDFLAQLGPRGDDDLFDDEGVTGMHAIERILYSDVTPQRVITFEASLPGYVPAAFPATAAQATEFESKLCGKLVADAGALLSQWTPADIDAAIAFQGLISLMNEQREKVQKASSNEEESRYSQRTMADLRDNLAGARVAYTFFQPWIMAKARRGDPTSDGRTIDGKIEGGFAELDGAYRIVHGDSIPVPPATWSAESPSPADLHTPFGQLYAVVDAAVDPTRDGSVVAEMNDAATALGFPTFRRAP
jgi:iron uptake system component EfeO